MTKPVLADHKRRGKRFIPPLLDAINFAEVSWAKNILPELLWLSLLIDAYDLRKGVELAVGIAETAQERAGDHPRPSFAFSSDYAVLSSSDKLDIIDRLTGEGRLEPVQHALSALHLYPLWPQSFLLDRVQLETNQTQDPETIQRLRRVVGELLPRRERPAILAQATAVYIAAITGKLRYTTNVSPPNLEAVVDYPNTEESQRVGASVGATINGLIRVEVQDGRWSSYFWNRGLEIDRCQVAEGVDDK